MGRFLWREDVDCFMPRVFSLSMQIRLPGQFI